ncbi:unnamed protein product, partial [Candidula unifasciata]
MTMDYHQQYSVYQEYYRQPYQGTIYQQQLQHHPHQQPRLHQSDPLRNVNHIGFPTRPGQCHPSQQQQQRGPSFQHFQQNTQQLQHLNYSSPYVPNFLVSSGSGLTPTLTPTTLATIEQSFMELQSSQQNGARDPVTQSGFVPPVVDPGHSADVSQDSLDYSSEYSDDWEPKSKHGRIMQDMKGMKNVNLIVTSTGTINATPQRKYTRRNKDEK